MRLTPPYFQPQRYLRIACTTALMLSMIILAASTARAGWVHNGNGSDDLDFSNDGGGKWTYTPVPDGNGADAAVTHVRILPKGSFNGAAGGSAPSFTLHSRVRVR